jgi:hypothetical protein
MVIRVLWNPENLLAYSEELAMDPDLGQFNPFHILTTYLFQTHCNIILPSTPKSRPR